MTIKTDNSSVIAKLQAENIDLINELAKCRDVFTFDEEMMQEALGNPLGVANFVESKVKQLQAENEALRKDAERYQCLRNQEISNGFQFDTPDGIGRFEVIQKTDKGVATYFGGERLDKAIDEFLAMKESE
jgi:hypothetical protein